MQSTSQTWKNLWAGGTAWLETKAVINGADYTEISNPAISRAVMQGGLGIGNAVSATCQFSVRTSNSIPKSAAVVIRTRLTNGTTASEWLNQGTFYISKRRTDPVTGIVSLECYDALLKANMEINDLLPNETWPHAMATLASDIAAAMGLTIDSSTTLATGNIYKVDRPDAGTTVHDVLCVIAAANGGSWVMSADNKLKLVKLKSAAGAASASSNVVDVTAVTGAIDVQGSGTITGVRYTTDNEPVILGDATGLVVDVGVGAAIASALYDSLRGMTYQAYTLTGAIYDPATEIGDYVRAGANGEVRSVLNSEAATYGVAFRGTMSAPADGEMSDEYPYIGATAKALTAAKVYAAKLVDGLNDSLTQQEVFNRLTNNGAAQGIYMSNNQLYVNAAYIASGYMSANRIQGGTLILGGLNNVDGTMQVLDAGGNVIGSWDKDGITLNKGTISGPTITLGGANNVDGDLDVYDANGNLLISADKDGLFAYKGEIGDFTLANGSMSYGSLAVGGTGAYIGNDGVIYNVTMDSGNTSKVRMFAQGLEFTWNGALAAMIFQVSNGLVVRCYDENGDYVHPIQLYNAENLHDVYCRYDARFTENLYVSKDTNLYGNAFVIKDLKVYGKIQTQGSISAGSLQLYDVPLSITMGGTGATTVAGARNALGLGNTNGALPIANGGTGETTAAAARNALGLGNTTGALPIANGGTGTTAAGWTALNNLGLNTKKVTYTLSNLTWGQSGAGKYYTEVTVSGVSKIISANISNWGGLRASDMVQIYIASDTKVGIFSNVNSFYASTSSVEVMFVYA